MISNSVSIIFHLCHFPHLCSSVNHSVIVVFFFLKLVDLEAAGDRTDLGRCGRCDIGIRGGSLHHSDEVGYTLVMGQSKQSVEGLQNTVVEFVEGEMVLQKTATLKAPLFLFFVY